MMKSLSTLIKLQKTYVDDQRIHLAQLLGRLDALDGRIAQLEIRKTRELEAARNNEASLTYGAFVKSITAEGRALEKERHTAMMAVKIAQDKLAMLFEEQKRYEIAEEARIEAEAREERRRETIMLDEIGGMMHERKRQE